MSAQTASPSENADRGEAETSEVLFLGYGIDDEKYSDYAGVDAAGKTILIYAGEPMDAEGRPYEVALPA